VFSLDILPVFVSARRRYCRTGWTKKLSSNQNLVCIVTKYWWILPIPHC